MLLAIREKVTGWIAYGIIFLISIPFALWGINSYFGGGEIQPAATVNGEEISARDLDQAYANYRQRLAQLFGGSIPDSFGGENALREEVLSQLIEELALRQYTEKAKYRVSDQELNRMIRSMDVFHTDGRFDTSIYQSQLRSLGYSPVGFEEELRRNRAMGQFQSAIRATAFTVPAEEQRYSSLATQTRSIRTLEYSVDADAVDVTDTEIEQHYQANAERYRIPEKVRIDYIELSLDTVKQGIVVSEEDVYARYLEIKDKYTSPEFREASHILIKADSDEESEAALAKIREIRQRIVDGEDFADLAREFSQDPGSASDGGNLGEIERGVMVQTFEDALFSLQVDELSEPVKTGFGWHLIKLHGISGGEERSFDSVRAELEEEMKTVQAESQIFDLVENLSNLAYEQPDSLVPASEQLDLPLQTSGWFDRFSGSGIASSPVIRQQAFSTGVLENGLNSEAIDLQDGRVVFIHLNQREAAKPQPLADVRETIREELVKQKIRERNLQAGNDALEQLKSGTTLEQLAQEWSASIVDYGFVGRDEAEVDARILQRTFSMPRPEDSKTFDGLLLSGGNFAVIELSAVLSTGEGADTSGEEIERLNEARGGAEYQSILKLLISRAEISRTPVEELQ